VFRFSHFVRISRIHACGQALVVFSLSACMSWRSEPVSPAQLIATKKPPVVRITSTDSSKLILRDPEVIGDTLYGRPQSSLEAEPADRTGIPLAGVQDIAILKSDPTKNTLLVIGVGVVTFSVLCAADALGCGPEETFVTAAGGTK
jgi:hypothetical protein